MNLEISPNVQLKQILRFIYKCYLVCVVKSSLLAQLPVGHSSSIVTYLYLLVIRMIASYVSASLAFDGSNPFAATHKSHTVKALFTRTIISLQLSSHLSILHTIG